MNVSVRRIAQKIFPKVATWSQECLSGGLLIFLESYVFILPAVSLAAFHWDAARLKALSGLIWLDLKPRRLGIGLAYPNRTLLSLEFQSSILKACLLSRIFRWHATKPKTPPVSPSHKRWWLWRKRNESETFWWNGGKRFFLRLWHVRLFCGR